MKRLRHVVWFVPAIWLAAALLVIRPGALEYRFNVQVAESTITVWHFAAAVYDPGDIAAFALRGANASLGRVPGRADEPPEEWPKELVQRLDGPEPPLAEKYYLEYPPATLLIFRLGFLTPCPMPAAVADSQQYGIAHHLPREDKPDELRVWSRFHGSAVTHLVLMTAMLYGLMLVLRRSYEPGVEAGPIWLCVLPAAVFFSLNRFDVVPALFTALAFLGIGRKQFALLSGAALAAGVLLKVYPVLFVPIILRHLGVRNGATWLAGFAGMILIGVGVSTAILGWEPTVRPILVQLSRPLEERSWTLYGRLLPMELGHMKNVRLGLLAVAALGLVATRPKDLDSVLRRCSVLLLVFISLAVFWSPQWVIWFLPMVVPLAARARWIAFVCVGLDLVNYLEFPVLFWILWDAQDWSWKWLGETLIFTRAAMWLALGAGLLWAEFRPRSPERCPTPSPSA
jgi:hypothetical protein